MKHLLLPLIFLLATFSSFGQVINVKPIATGAGDGKGWDNAANLNDAVAMATNTSVLWLQGGTYNLTETLVVPEGVKIFGGFSGTETQIEQRNFETNRTIIDAQLLFAAIELGPLAVLNGVTVRNGVANIPTRMNGGGVLMQAGSKIEYCRIIDNIAAGYGGGIYAVANSEIFNSVIAGNKAAEDGFAVAGDEVIFRSNTVVNNSKLNCNGFDDQIFQKELCSGETMLLEAAIVTDATYKWNTGATSRTITTSALTADSTYIVTITAPTFCVLTQTFEITINTSPDPITGPEVVGIGQTIQLESAPAGGAWTSTHATIASVTSDGVVTGYEQGTTTIRYTIYYPSSARCYVTHVVSVQNCATITPLPGSVDRAVCLNDMMPDIIYNVVGATAAATQIVWRENNATGTIMTLPPNGIDFSNADHSVTIGGTPTVSGTFHYTISTTDHHDACLPKSVEGTIIVHNAVLPGTITTTRKEICNGEIPELFTSSQDASGGYVSGNMYQWQVSSNGVDFVNIEGANSEIHQSPALEETRHFRRQYNNTCGTEPHFSDTITITVSPPPTPPTTERIEPNTDCSGEDPNGLIEIAEQAGVHYAISSASLPRTTFGPERTFSNREHETYTIYVKDVNTFCISYTTDVEVSSEDEIPTLATMGVTPDTSICSDFAGDITISPTFNNVGDDPIYQWFIGTKPDTVRIAGATTRELSMPTQTPRPTSTTYYTVRVLNVENNCAAYYSKAITVVNQIVLSPIQIDGYKSICVGQTQPILRLPEIPGVTTYYQWERSTDNITFTAITSATARTQPVSNSSASANFYRCRVTTPGGVCPPVFSDTVQVHVLEVPTVISTTGYERCSTGVATISAIASAGASIDWFSYATYGTFYGDSPSGEGFQTESVSSPQTIFWAQANNGACTSLTRMACTVNVRQKHSIYRYGNHTQSICQGGIMTAPISHSYAGGATGFGGIIWEGPNGGTSEPLGLIGTAENISGTVAPNAIPGAYAWTIITSPSGGVCPPDTSRGTITIEALPDPITGPEVVGVGLTIQLESAPAGGVWTSTNTTIASVNTDEGVVIGHQQGTATIRYTISYPSSVMCHVTRAVSVVNCPEITLLPGREPDQSVCHNDMMLNIIYNVSRATASAMQIVWRENNAAGTIMTLPPSGIDFDNAGTTVTIGGRPTASGTFHYTITTTDHHVACLPTSAEGTIIVHNAVVPGTIATSLPMICYGGTPAPFTSEQGGSGGYASGNVYQWQISSDGINFVNIAGAVYGTYQAPALEETRHFRRQYYNFCGSEPYYSNTITITVNQPPPAPTAARIEPNTDCSGENPNGLIEIAAQADVRYAISSASLPRTTFGPGRMFINREHELYTIYVLDLNTGCINSSTVEVPSEDGIPTLTTMVITPSDSIYSSFEGTITISPTFNNAGIAPAYRWFLGTKPDTVRIADATTRELTIPTQTPQPTLRTTYYTVRVQNIENNCAAYYSRSITVVDSELTPAELTAINCATGVPNSGTFGTVAWGGNTTISVHRTVGDQQWSDVVSVTNCDKTSWDSPGTAPFQTECRNSDGNNNFHGHYFSWCFVMRYAARLCPSPWRVPTVEDFRALHTTLGHTLPALGSSVNIIANTYMGTANSQVGGRWGGSRFTGHAASVASAPSFYWSSSEADNTHARALYFGVTDVGPENSNNKGNGFALRCVRDLEPLPMTGCNDATPGWGADGLGTITWGNHTNTDINSRTTTIRGTGGRLNQEWSGAVQATNCRKGNATNNNEFNGGHQNNTFNADCRQTLHASNNGGISLQGHYFSWCAVMRFANDLCPPGDGWRVPTQQDFIDLDMNLEGTGQNRSASPSNIYCPAFGDATNPQFGGGGTWGGARWTAFASTLASESSIYWSSTESSATEALRLLYAASNINLQINSTKNLGLALRCVRNPEPLPMTGCNDATPGWGASGLGTITWGNSTNTDINSGTTIVPGTDERPTQIWSGAVQAFNCRKGNATNLNEFDGGEPDNFNADCRRSLHAFNNSNNSQQGHYFTWCAVMRFADDLCPPGDGWRVPTRQDFLDLDSNLGGNGLNRGGDPSNIYCPADGSASTPQFGGRWGGARWTGAACGLTGGHSYYWSSTEGATQAFSLIYNATNINPRNFNFKDLGFHVRCVRNPEPLPMTGCNNATPGWGAGGLGTITYGNSTNQNINSGATTIIGTEGRLNQEWSGAVQADNCRKGNATGNNQYHGGSTGNYNADCRQSLHAFENGEISLQGHYFSWCAVMRFANTLCPPGDGWRVPTQQDFIDLDMNLGGTGANNQAVSARPMAYMPTTGNATAPQFGGTWGGARWTAHAGGLLGTLSYYWSSIEISATNAFGLAYDGGTIYPQHNDLSKANGFQVRCVRNVETVPIPSCNDATPGWGASGLGTITWGNHTNTDINSETTTIVGIGGSPNQEWSGAVQAGNCRKGNATGNNEFNGGGIDNYSADCRQTLHAFNNDGISLQGHYFSWCAVMRFANTLCPPGDGWRVPTPQDFIDLDINLGGSGAISQSISTRLTDYMSAAGDATNPELGGRWGGSRFTASAGGLTNTWSSYWSSTEQAATTAFRLYYDVGAVSLQSGNLKNSGFPVRCVRNVETVPIPGCNDANPGWGASGLGTITWGNHTNTDINSETTTIAGTGGRPTQIWSGAVQAGNCRKGNATDGNQYHGGTSDNYSADCRQTLHAFNNEGISLQGHYFSWCAVMRFANTLCPPGDGWRVPTQQDFINLDMNLNGTGANSQNVSARPVAYMPTTGDVTNPQLGGTWGGSRFTAYANELTLTNSFYWSSTEFTTTDAFNLHYGSSLILPQGHNGKSNGFQVRCVRNPNP
jgi:uncharacterized protein (TIGR02145 family)